MYKFHWHLSKTGSLTFATIHYTSSDDLFSGHVSTAIHSYDAFKMISAQLNRRISFTEACPSGSFGLMIVRRSTLTYASILMAFLSHAIAFRSRGGGCGGLAQTPQKLARSTLTEPRPTPKPHFPIWGPPSGSPRGPNQTSPNWDVKGPLCDVASRHLYGCAKLIAVNFYLVIDDATNLEPATARSFTYVHMYIHTYYNISFSLQIQYSENLYSI